MSEDLIRRSDAIKALDANFTIKGKENMQTVLNYLELVRTRIEGAPTIEPKREWTPCSERLPEEDGFYLATITDDGERFETAKMVYVGSEWIDPGFWEYEVVAWMPLPAPWKGADDE